jgi:protein SCO1/2
MSIRTVRIWLWILVVVALVGVGGYMVYSRFTPPVAVADGFGRGTYALVDQNGAPVDQTMFEGHPSALFFGFTHCPEVCPTTLAEMANWFDTLGDEGRALKAYFVTVDPERDTPEIIGDYVSFLSDRITGVTGSPEEIAKIVKAWGVHAERIPLDSGDYTMDHTASVFLIDGKGEFQGTIAYREDTQTALGKLRNLLSKS